MQFESNGYPGSPSEDSFHRIDKDLNQRFTRYDDRQKETKDLIVSFALYADGTKQPRELSSQRKYLRGRFEESQQNGGKEGAQRFIQGLADMAEFRRHFWDKDGISELTGPYPAAERAQLQLCFSFIRGMNTSICVPAAARYWGKFQEDRISTEFLQAIKALTSFIVLRRAATGGTARIDSDFRDLMEDKKDDSLCVGLQVEQNSILSISQLQEKLRQYLSHGSVGVTDKESWVLKACSQPLAIRSSPLTRFLLLAAAHDSQPDEQRPGFWRRKDAVRTTERRYLAFDCWTNGLYRTIEHVAPRSKTQKGWDESIYHDADTRHTLGNLVLLPQEENSVAGNSG